MIVTNMRGIALPEGWDRRPIASFSRAVATGLTTDALDVNGTTPLFDAQGQIGNTNSKPIDAPYVTIIKDGAGVGKVRILPKNSTFLGTMNGLITDTTVDLKYFYYVLAQSSFFLENITTIPHIYFRDYSKEKILVPPRARQSKIVNFLDLETAKIDHLISKQRQLIDLVKARETARRNQVLDAVSGTPVRLKWLLSPSRTRAAGSEEVLSVYRDYGVIRKDSRADNFNRTPEDVSNYLLVRPGDLVVNKMKAWQGSLGVSEFHGIASGDYEVLRPLNAEVDLQFLHLLLRSRRYVNEYAIRSKGIRPSQWRLYWQELSEIEIPLPPISTQKTVVESVGGTKGNHALLDTCERMIELLRERRSALVTAAVTGQIEV